MELFSFFKRFRRKADIAPVVEALRADSDLRARAWDALTFTNGIRRDLTKFWQLLENAAAKRGYDLAGVAAAHGYFRGQPNLEALAELRGFQRERLLESLTQDRILQVEIVAKPLAQTLHFLLNRKAGIPAPLLSGRKLSEVLEQQYRALRLKLTSTVAELERILTVRALLDKATLFDLFAKEDHRLDEEFLVISGLINGVRRLEERPGAELSPGKRSASSTG